MYFIAPKKEMKYNYHTHTTRCMHATGTEEEYILAAIEAGYDEIGFSDHGPWPYENFVSPMRMLPEDIDGYVKTIKALREKYKDKISIKLGFESEYFEEYIPWLKEQIEKYELDYVILGHHYSPHENGGAYNGELYTPQEVENYTNDVLKALDSGIYSYIAHPDLFLRRYPEFDECCEDATRKIIAKAIETDTPLEYNLLGLFRSKLDNRYGYPYPNFWEIAAQMKAKCVIGVDAHSPDAYLDFDLRKEAQEHLESLGMTVAEKIRFFR